MRWHDAITVFLCIMQLSQAVGRKVVFNPLDDTTWYYPLKIYQPDMLYNIVGNNDTKVIFHIIPHTNLLSNRTSLLYAPSREMYEVSVECPYGRETLSVVILSNLHAPKFNSSVYKLRVLDSKPVFNTILDASAIDDDLNEPANIIKYKLERPSSFFDIDEHSGKIFLTKSLSLDENFAMTYTFDVVATDGGPTPLSSKATVTIDVIRNQPPKFGKTYYNVLVSDRAPVLDHVIITVTATDDRNNGTEGKLKYSIVSEDARRIFQMNETTGDIVPRVQLTYPTQKIWKVVVDVHDASSPPLKNVAQVTIVIVSPPKFSHPTYTARIDAEAPILSKVQRIVANETTGTVPIRYSLTGDKHALNYFSIEQTTGNIRIEQLLTQDHTKPKSYTLKCKAYPEGFETQVTETTVTVLVSHKSIPPKFLREELFFELKEDFTGELLALGSYINDPEGVKFSLQSDSFDPPNAAKFFTVDEDSGVMSVGEDFKIDTFSEYQFTAVAEGRENPQPKSTLTVSVFVKRNLYVPTFVNATYVKVIKEVFPVGKHVLTVSAIDKDKDKISYFIDECSPSRDFFTIDSIRGDIFLNRSLLSEQRSEFVFDVTAKDNAEFPKNSTTKVNITVIRNGNQPIFQPQNANLTLSEYTVVNTVVGRVEAKDADPPQTLGGQLVYGSNGSTFENCSDLFSVIPTGHIVLQKNLTGLSGDKCLMKVLASDRSSKPRSASTVLTVNIVKNQHTPAFLAREKTVEIDEPNNVNRIVYNASATDADSLDAFNRGTPNAKVEFSLPGNQTAKSYFGITQSGQVYVANQLNPQQTYLVVIKASDSGWNPKYSEMTLKVMTTYKQESKKGEGRGFIGFIATKIKI